MSTKLVDNKTHTSEICVDDANGNFFLFLLFQFWKLNYQVEFRIISTVF